MIKHDYNAHQYFNGYYCSMTNRHASSETKMRTAKYVEYVEEVEEEEEEEEDLFTNWFGVFETKES